MVQMSFGWSLLATLHVAFWSACCSRQFWECTQSILLVSQCSVTHYRSQKHPRVSWPLLQSVKTLQPHSKHCISNKWLKVDLETAVTVARLLMDSDIKCFARYVEPKVCVSCVMSPSLVCNCLKVSHLSPSFLQDLCWINAFYMCNMLSCKSVIPLKRVVQ